MRRPRTLLALALTLLLGLAPLIATVDAQDATTTPRVKRLITSEDAGVEKMFEAFDADKLVLVDVNGEGLPEVVAHNDNNRVYVINPRTGKVLWEKRTFLPSNWSYREIAAPAVGDLEGNGRVDLVVANTMGVVTRYEFDPWNSTTSKFEFQKLWQHHVSPEQIQPGFYANHTMFQKTGPAFDGGPYLADADGDGVQEIFLISDNVHGIYTFNADGTLKWGSVKDNANTNPTPADLDGDGTLEIVYVTDDGQVFAMDAASGSVKWTFHGQTRETWPASIAQAPSVIDVDGDGKKEIFFGARVAVKNDSDPEWYLKQHARYFLLDSNGKKRWDVSLPNGAPMYSNRAAAQDCSGDGGADLIFMDWNAIGHKPGNWESTGPPHLYCLDARTGQLHWQTKLEGTFYGNKDPIVSDADGDGTMDILVNNAQNGKDGYAWYDLQGQRKGWTPVPDGWKVVNDATAGDVDGDGKLDLVVPLAHSLDEENYRKLAVGYREGAIAVIDFGIPARIGWSANWLFNHDWQRPYDEVTGHYNPPTRPYAAVKTTRASPLTIDVNATGMTVSRADVRAGANATAEWTPLSSAGGTSWSRDGMRVREGDVVHVLLYDEKGRPVTLTTIDTLGDEARGGPDESLPGNGLASIFTPAPSPLGALLAATAFLLLKRGNSVQRHHEPGPDSRPNRPSAVRGRPSDGRSDREDRR